jgi:hypothetical protein
MRNPLWMPPGDTTRFQIVIGYSCASLSRFDACFILKIGNKKLNINFIMRKKIKKMFLYSLKHSRIENIKLMFKIKIDVNSKKKK